MTGGVFQIWHIYDPVSVILYKIQDVICCYFTHIHSGVLW
jgi:hypothetical protein